MSKVCMRLERIAKMVCGPYAHSVSRTMDGYDVTFGFLQPKDGAEAGEWNMVVVKFDENRLPAASDVQIAFLLSQAVAKLDALPGAFVEHLHRLEAKLREYIKLRLTDAHYLHPGMLSAPRTSTMSSRC